MASQYHVGKFNLIRRHADTYEEMKKADFSRMRGFEKEPTMCFPHTKDFTTLGGGCSGNSYVCIFIVCLCVNMCQSVWVHVETLTISLSPVLSNTLLETLLFNL